MTARTLFTAAAALALAAGVSGAAVTPAAADGAGFAAGLIGGTALGAIAGSAIAAPRYAPAPVYVAPPPGECWFERRPVLDPYGYVVGYRRTRVCE